MIFPPFGLSADLVSIGVFLLLSGISTQRASFEKGKIAQFRFHERRAVVITHGLAKKTQKLPPKEIERAAEREVECEEYPGPHAFPFPLGLPSSEISLAAWCQIKYAVSIVSIMLVLSFTSIGFPGEKYRWYIIKGKDGVCKVISADKKTPHTIAGPYKTRENALEAKSKKCKASKKKKSKARK